MAVDSEYLHLHQLCDSQTFALSWYLQPSPAGLAVRVFVLRQRDSPQGISDPPRCLVCLLAGGTSHHHQQGTRGEQSSWDIRGWVQTGCWTEVREIPSCGWDRCYEGGSAVTSPSWAKSPAAPDCQKDRELMRERPGLPQAPLTPHPRILRSLVCSWRVSAAVPTWGLFQIQGSHP